MTNAASPPPPKEPRDSTASTPATGDASAGPEMTGSPPYPEPRLQADPAGEPNFQPGDFVAGRYWIVRFIARGGMGEVYAAEDIELGDVVALKTVRPRLARDEGTLRRLRREIHLARRVTHPNVCRLFDISHHPPSSEQNIQATEPRWTFLTMELLEGESLAQKIQRDGPLPPAEALPIALQMADGLHAAHQAGVIHRDFKPGNVLLVPTGPGIRAVITDFGLAVSEKPDGEAATLTVTGAVLGTPPYLSPEQLEDKTLSPATDLYALGLVLYEMLTAQRPFDGDTVMSGMIRRLRERAPSPRLIVPDLPRSWEAVILRCLARRPEDRFKSAEAVAQALRGERLAWRRRGWLVPLVASLMLLVALLTGMYFLSGRGRPTGDVAPPGATSRTLRASAAVLGFRNLSGRPEHAWLSNVFTELLGMELAAGETLRVVSGESIAQLKSDLGLEETESLAPSSLERIRTANAVDLVLVGSYLALSKKEETSIRLVLRVQDTIDGQTLVQTSETGTEKELFDLIARAGAAVRNGLGVTELSEAEEGGLRAQAPATAEAARLYAEGLTALRRGEALAARGLLEQAVAAAPDSPLSHSALSAAWTEMGDNIRAREAARRAYELSAPLSREGRLQVEGRYRQTMGEWQRAIEVQRALWEFFPDNLEYGLELAAVQSAAGAGEEALTTVAKMRELPAPLNADPRIDLAEATAAAALSDFRRQKQAAERAIAGAQERGSRLLVAEAQLSEWWAHRNLGEQEEAAATAQSAKEIYQEAGHRGGLARALNAIATTHSDLGQLDEAYAADMEALEIFQVLGDKRRIGWSLNNLARLHRARGQLDEAFDRYQQTIDIAREIGDRSGLGRALANAGQILLIQGQTSRAKELFEQSLSVRREIGERRGVAGALLDLSRTLHRQGRLVQARQQCMESMETFRTVGDVQSLTYVLAHLGLILRDQGELDEARKRQEESLALREELGAKTLLRENRLALARLDLDEGRPDEAERRILGLLEGASTGLLSRKDAIPLAVLALALLDQEQVEAARQRVGQALELVDGASSTPDALAVRLSFCRIAAAATPSESLGTLRDMIQEIKTEAERQELTGLVLEAERVQGMTELAFGQEEVGLKRLRELQKRAHALGYHFLSRQVTERLGD